MMPGTDLSLWLPRTNQNAEYPGKILRRNIMHRSSAKNKLKSLCIISTKLTTPTPR